MINAFANKKNPNAFGGSLGSIFREVLVEGGALFTKIHRRLLRPSKTNII